ncbi:hypothetical protein ACN24M_03085 [Streptomyces microflavus]|uniref:hypothetical protein n=1 Tax=Streptomyces TaxID=1883 RepID=UPI00397FFAAD
MPVIDTSTSPRLARGPVEIAATVAFTVTDALLAFLPSGFVSFHRSFEQTIVTRAMPAALVSRSSCFTARQREAGNSGDGQDRTRRAKGLRHIHQVILEQRRDPNRPMTERRQKVLLAADFARPSAARPHRTDT